VVTIFSVRSKINFVRKKFFPSTAVQEDAQRHIYCPICCYTKVCNASL